MWFPAYPKMRRAPQNHLERFTSVSWSLGDIGTDVTSEERELFIVARGGGVWNSLFCKSWPGTPTLVFLLTKWTYFPRRRWDEQLEQGSVGEGWPTSRGCPWKGTSNHWKSPHKYPIERKSQHLVWLSLANPCLTAEPSLKNLLFGSWENWTTGDGGVWGEETNSDHVPSQAQVPRPQPLPVTGGRRESPISMRGSGFLFWLD